MNSLTGTLGNLGGSDPLAPVQGVVNQVVGTLSGAGAGSGSPITPITNLVGGLQNALPTSGNAAGGHSARQNPKAL